MIAIKNDVKTYTKDEVETIVAEAAHAARAAADTFFHDVMDGQDQGACGFAWVNIYDIKGNTRVGKYLAACDVTKAYGGGLRMWNPSRYPVQNIDTLEVGARAAAEVFQHYGFTAYAGSRLD